MSDLIDAMKKGLFTGVGLALMARDRVEEMADDMAKSTKMSTKEGRKFVKEMVQSSKEAQAELRKQVHSTIGDVLKEMNVATHDEIKTLKARIAHLEKELGARPAKAPGAKAAKKPQSAKPAK